MKTPDYYLPVMPYLIMDKVTEFVAFMKAVFNAQERMMVLREDGSVMHGEISIGKAVIMFTDSTGHYKSFPAGMFILIENIDEVFDLAMQNGAICLQGLDDREYGRSAGFQDKFGNQWWLTKPE
jgi:PhnB protein